jgi:DNA modification methylase
VSLVTVLHGHVLDQLKTLEPNTVQTCITSPPYWGLRAYGTPPQVWLSSRFEAADCEHTGFRDDGTCEACGSWRGELGLEPTPQLYVEHLVSVFREVRRVLRPDGTLWLNLGDSHARDSSVRWDNTLHREAGWKSNQATRTAPNAVVGGYKPKDLVGIPWMAAFALRADGWYLRSDNVWAKGVSGQRELTGQLRLALKKAGLTPDQVHKTLSHIEPYVGNCMPESVKDRTTKSHEYVFLLSKGKHPYCDMAEVEERATAPVSGRRNRRSVWLIPPVPYKGAHFATMPPALVEPCVLAATSPQGQCTICGTPWVALRVKGAPLAAQQAASGADKAGEYHGEGQKDYADGLAQNPSDVKRRILAGMRERTVTWGPACLCGVGAEPQTVLDPFGGSGTTAMVATKFGRRAITVELNETYLPLIEQRLKAGK